jgi:hypothetical protein
LTVSSRKSFLAKLAGLIGLAGIAPRMLLGARRSTASSTPLRTAVKTDPRAVARREDAS